jgi:hypothetical protein
MKKNSSFSFTFSKILEGLKMAGRPVLYLSLILLFIITSTYLFCFGNGIFFYQENKMLFIFSKEYFQKFAVIPGGLLTYVANFLAQGYFSSLYGSLIISIILILVCFVLIRIYKRLSSDNSFSLLFILFPSCLLLILHTRYDYYIQYCLGYLLVLLWFLVSLIPEKKQLRFIILLLFPLFYYLVGSFAWIYLGIYIIFSRIYIKGILGSLLSASLIIVAVLTFIVFKEILFLQPVDRLLGYPLFINISSSFSIWLVLLGGFIILFPLFIKKSGLINVNNKVRQIIPLFTILAAFPIIVFLLFKRYDPDIANLTKLEKSVYNQDWDAVIEQHERSPSANVIGQYYYNLALSEKGQLCDRLFFGSQSFGPMSLTLPRDNEHSYRAVYFFYAIGLVSEAHHLAYELMVQHGYVPENIKLLIKTELINGNYKIAERYINVLKKTLHYRSWAKKYEKMLLDTALINTDPELGEKIRLMPKRDFFIVPNDVQTIELFLKENPDNRKLFEYKIARLMLEKDLLATVNEVKKMKEIGYTSIPRHIEEVVVAYINLAQDSPDLGGLTINPDTERRFVQYRLISNSYKGNKSLVEKNMKKEEKNTFWYYLQFNVISSDFWESNPEDFTVY